MNIFKRVKPQSLHPLPVFRSPEEALEEGFHGVCTGEGRQERVKIPLGIMSLCFTKTALLTPDRWELFLMSKRRSQGSDFLAVSKLRVPEENHKPTFISLPTL